MSKAFIRNKVRKSRFEKGEMTQQELADLCGCTRQTVIMLEQEKYVPSLSLAFRIAKALESSIEDIFEYVSGPG